MFIKKYAILTTCSLSIFIIATAIAFSILQDYCLIPSHGVIKVSSPSYIIYKNGTHIFAFNNVTCKIELNSTDARTVIQYAVDTLAEAGGGKILLRDGEYDLSDEILFGDGYSYITLEGESWNTILKTNNGTYNAIRFFGSDEYPNVGCVIRNLKIDGGFYADGEHPQWDEKNGIMTTSTVNSIFENLFITNTGRTGIYNTQGSNGNVIRNNYLYRCHRFGISYTSSNRGTVVNNIVKECGNGIVWDSTYGNNWYTIFANNILINNTFADLYALGTESSPTKYGIYVNNTLYTGGQYSIWMQYVYDVAIINNTIYYSGTGTSIIQFRASNVIISNNKIHGRPYESFGIWGVNNIVIDRNLIDASELRAYWGENIQIKNNQFINSGVVVESDCTNTIVASNIGLTSISDSGTNTRIYNNTGYSGTQLNYYVAVNPPSFVTSYGGSQLFVAAIVGGMSPYVLEWKIDNVIRPETGNSLSFSSTSVGVHVVSIRVKDAAENLASDNALIFVQWAT